MPFVKSIGVKVVLLAVSLYLLSVAYHQATMTAQMAWLWPKIALWILVASIVVGIFKDTRSKPWRKGVRVANDAPRETRPFLVATALTIGYVFALPYLGFLFVNALFLPSFMLVAGYRRSRLILSTTIIGPIALSFIFQRFLTVVFPVGVSPFSVATVAIYKFLKIY